MNEYRKAEYLNFIFRKAKADLSGYEISNSERELINNLFLKLAHSENLLKDLFILTHIRELSNLGKYFIFILKKIEDNVINFDNFTQNINTDSNFIEKELLKYLSNPESRKRAEIEIDEEEEQDSYESEGEYLAKHDKNEFIDLPGSDENEFQPDSNLKNEEDIEEDEEFSRFTKNYLELIQTEENINEEEVFELPKTGNESDSHISGKENDIEIKEKTVEGEENVNVHEIKSEVTNESDLADKEKNESAFDLPDEATLFSDSEKTDIAEKDIRIYSSEVDSTETGISAPDLSEIDTAENIESDDEVEEESEEIITEVESSFTIKKVFSAGDNKEDKETKTGEVKKLSFGFDEEIIPAEDNKEPEDKAEGEDKSDERIKLSKDIQENLDLFEKGLIKENEGEEVSESEVSDDDAENIIEEEISAADIFDEEEANEPEPTNAEFLEYEGEIKKRNRELEKEFDIMIYLVTANPGDEKERDSIISSIAEQSEYLENISRKMSLEIISNIYQTITLSFEKISDGKYDISESTLNLFKKGLSLVVSLINGEDYFGYKNILRSIENIRNSLIEEKKKKEEHIKNLREKEEIEKQISSRFPDDTQREKINLLKHLIKDTEFKLNSLDKITGEYQIYEALRSLSTNLINLKEIVKISKELGINKMVQLAEASYIFIKFLQNYRINPVSTETKEIFGYIIYNLKSLIVNRKVEDLDLFISYLNDPVKIFSKKNNKKS